MQTSNVVSIGGLTPPDLAVPETVAELEGALLRAKSGELRSVVIVGVKANDNIVSSWHSENQYYTLLGAISWLAHRMNTGE